MALLEKNLDEPKWLQEKREKAKVAFEKELLPDRVSHLWKYTDPSIFLFDLKKNKASESHIKFYLPESALNQGVLLYEINEVINKNEIVEKYFDKLLEKELDKVNLLNEAYWNTGYFLYIPKNIKLEEPIIVKSFLETDGFQAKRVLICLEENASVNLIDESVSPNGVSSIVNIVSEIFLEKNSNLNYLNVNLTGNETINHLFQRTSLEENSTLTNLIVALGGKTSKSDISSILSGKNSSSNIYGIVLGDNKQHFDHHTTLNHQASFTNSILNFRVALKDKSKSAYTGNLKITHEALKCSAVQENRNLLLSKDAKAESIPELEILTNDVEKCSHGVTMGQVDKEQIYFLMSRGLSQNEAEKMIIEGFLEPTISRIPDETLREEVRLKIDQKLLAL